LGQGDLDAIHFFQPPRADGADPSGKREPRLVHPPTTLVIVIVIVIATRGGGLIRLGRAVIALGVR
jgi:hypothetical protein